MCVSSHGARHRAPDILILKRSLVQFCQTVLLAAGVVARIVIVALVADPIDPLNGL